MNTPVSNSFINSASSGLDFSLLDEKSFLSGPKSAAEQPAAKGSNLIDFSQSGSKGTSMASLLNPETDGLDKGQNSELSQGIAQLVAEIMKALMPLLQQIMQGQQSGNTDSNAQAGGAGSTQTPAGNSEADAGDTPATASPPDSAPDMPVLSAEDTQSVTPPATAETTANSPAISTSSGSDLHLPESLKPYETDIQHAAQSTGVPANLLAAQIWQESRGNLGASTVNGGNGLQDAGLMQVNSNTFADLQSKNPDLLGANASPNNPRDNVMAGALYMKEQLNAFDGNMGAALRAYNSGPNNVNLADLSDISKTGTGDSTYVDKVMGFANTIATGKGALPA